MSRSQTIRLLLASIAVLAVCGGAWWYQQRPAPASALTLYGNVDFRQASLPFNGSERIAEILVEEGDLVRKGQVLGRLDTARLAPQVAQIEAMVAAQKAVVDRLKAGSRPEEIAQARAYLEAAQADAVNARAQFERRKTLLSRAAISEQDLDIAAAATTVADAQVVIKKRALDLSIAGPRVEEIAQAEAQLRGTEAQLALARRQLADAELVAPFDGVVRSRLMEPGEMASPMRPVLALATTGIKWVRSYVAETRLGLVKPGMKARVICDSFPDRPLDGWVGFISPIAEFTPKTVQTEELRTSLVYEVRIFVDDRDQVMRLGMPATVQLLPDGATPAASRP